MSPKIKEPVTVCPINNEFVIGYKNAIIDFRQMMNCGFSKEQMWKVFKPALINHDLPKIPSRKGLTE